MKNYYELLEVNPKASKEIIEKAYKVLIKQCHPDGYVGDEKLIAEEKTRELNEAYHILSDDFLRNQYDLELQKEYENEKRASLKNRNINEANQNEYSPYNQNQNEYSPYNQNQNVYSAYQQNQGIQQNQENSQEQKEHSVGSFMALVDIFNEVFKKRKTRNGSPKKLVKEDWMAIGLTIVIALAIGIICWFIPFTKGFIRGLNPFSS